MSNSNENILMELRKKIDGQEMRLYQRNIDETRSQYEQAKKRELETSQMLVIEKNRCQNQEREICRRRAQLEESTLCIKKLQAELENARQISNGVQWELRENEIKSLSESEISQYRTKISGLEAKLKRKQLELETAQEMLIVEQAKMNQDRDELSLLLEQKDRTLNECLEKLKNSNSIQNQQNIESVHERIGALTVTVENLRDRIDSLQGEKSELEDKLRYAEEDNSLLKNEINSLKDQLTDSEGISQQTSVYLTDEIDKIKHQKAQLRCEFLQLQRENKRLENELKTAKEDENLNAYQAELTNAKSQLNLLEQENKDLSEEKNLLRREIKTLENSLKEYKFKLENAQILVKESEDRESVTITQLNNELEISRKKMNSMRQALLELDSQCEKLMTRIRIVDQNKKTIQQENHMLQKEADDLKKQIETHCKLENELVSIKEENQRLLSKINYLENELKESQKDYREEISKMADQLTQTKQKMENQKEPIISVNLLESKLLQEESHRRYLERSVEQTKKESAAVNKELVDIRNRQCNLINENTTLRQALSEAIKKTEQYRDQNLEFKSQNENLISEINEINEKLMRYEDKLCVLNSELEQKEKLTGYLQSVVQPKQMQKLRREPNSQSSTLISNGSASSEIQMETQEVEILQRQRDNLRKDLEHQRRVLNERQVQNQYNKVPPPMELNEAVPLIRKKPLNMSSEYRYSSPKGKENLSLSLSSPSRIGTMRHDIPHRWKTQFITITSSLCGVCLEGLPHFGHIYKCRECSLMIHSHCSYSVVNSCGFPTACADFYLDSHSLSNGGSMTGWIKLWRSDDRAGNKWRNAWATIDQNQLRFYDSDNLAVSDGSPFMSIDLVEEYWKIFNQVGQPIDGVPRESMSMIIEIKLPKFTLFMLAPTVQAKQRWVRSLQFATNRRIFVQRRPSTVALFSQLLALNKPQNIMINSTQILDGEWLLMGCHEGLFVTNILSPRSPINIAGIPAIYFLELVMENDMLLAICGSARLLVAIHLHQLRKAVCAEYQPTVQYTTISNIDNCHIAVVSKIEHNQKRYIYLATTEAIHILNFVEKLGVFSPLHRINTEEPCMCICSTSSGFIFGADNFYFVSFDDFSYKPLTIDNCPSDFPIASLEINPNEYLLAFHNYGVFVTANGQRTRYENVDWDRIPLEFVYNAPYLYIVYCDFLEIAKVASYEDFQSRTLTDDRNMFKCRSAHRTGRGIKPTEEIFVVSTDDRVELHIFNSQDVELNNKSMKRKLVDSLSRPQNKKKN